MKVLKRITGLFLAVVMLCFTGMGVADGTVSRKDYMLSVAENVNVLLRQLIDIYESDPDDFDADYCFLMYSYYAQGMALRRVNTFEELWEKKELTDLLEKDLIRDYGEDYLKTERAFIMVESIINDEFTAWANGETSDKDFAKSLIVSIKSLVLGGEE